MKQIIKNNGKFNSSFGCKTCLDLMNSGCVSLERLGKKKAPKERKQLDFYKSSLVTKFVSLAINWLISSPLSWEIY
jgi:hypothetical protein